MYMHGAFLRRIYGIHIYGVYTAYRYGVYTLYIRCNYTAYVRWIYSAYICGAAPGPPEYTWGALPPGAAAGCVAVLQTPLHLRGRAIARRGQAAARAACLTLFVF